MNPSPIDVIRREGHCRHSLPHLDNYIIFQKADASSNLKHFRAKRHENEPICT